MKSGATTNTPSPHTHTHTYTGSYNFSHLWLPSETTPTLANNIADTAEILPAIKGPADESASKDIADSAGNGAAVKSEDEALGLMKEVNQSKTFNVTANADRLSVLMKKYEALNTDKPLLNEVCVKDYEDISGSFHKEELELRVANAKEVEIDEHKLKQFSLADQTDPYDDVQIDKKDEFDCEDITNQNETIKLNLVPPSDLAIILNDSEITKLVESLSTDSKFGSSLDNAHFNMMDEERQKFKPTEINDSQDEDFKTPKKGKKFG